MAFGLTSCFPNLLQPTEQPPGEQVVAAPGLGGKTLFGGNKRRATSKIRCRRPNMNPEYYGNEMSIISGNGPLKSLARVL